MKKILMVENCDTESNLGDNDDTPDEQIGGDSSKSNSITSEQSIGLPHSGSQVCSNHLFHFS